MARLLPGRHWLPLPVQRMSIITTMSAGLNIAALARRTGVAPDTLHQLG